MPRRRQEARLWCNVYLTDTDDHRFIPQIIGQRGANIEPIARVTNSKIRVRGRGSKHQELNGREADVPLMVSISTASTDGENFAEEVSQVLHLLEGKCNQGPSRGYSFAPMTEAARKTILQYHSQSVSGMRLPVFSSSGTNVRLTPLIPGCVSQSMRPMRIEEKFLVWASVFHHFLIFRIARSLSWIPIIDQFEDTSSYQELALARRSDQSTLTFLAS